MPRGGIGEARGRIPIPIQELLLVVGILLTKEKVRGSVWRMKEGMKGFLELGEGVHPARMWRD